MSVVMVRGAKGGPGATTIATALATWWPERRRLLVEADPDGGVLAARFGLGVEPGLVSLAAAGHLGIDEGLIAGHCQQLSDGLAVLAAPVLPDQVRAALAVTATPLARCLARLGDAGVVVDIGRAWPGDVVAPLVEAADGVVVVCRPSVEGLGHVGALVGAFGARVPRVGVVLVGDSPYSAAEVAAALAPGGREVVWGVVPADARQAEILNGQRGGWNWAGRRLPLVRAARELANDIAERVRAPRDETESAPSPGAGHAVVWSSEEMAR